MSVFPCTGEPRIGDFPRCYLISAEQRTCLSDCWQYFVIFNLVSIGTKSFSTKLLSSWVAPRIHCQVLSLSMCRILHSSLFNCMIFLSAHFFSLLRFLWMATQPSTASTSPPLFCVISKLPEGTLHLSSRSLMKMLNETGPSIDPWGVLSVPGLLPA